MQHQEKSSVFFWDWIVELGIFTGIFVWFGLFAICGVDDHHDGLVLKASMDVASGKMLFRETFYNYGILQPYFFAFFLRIFGCYLLVLKLLTVVFYGVIGILTYAIWKSLMPRLLAILTVLLWFFLAPFYYTFNFMHIWSSVYSAFCIMLAEYILMRSFQPHARHEFRLLFLTGISIGCAFCFRQPVGAFAFLALILYFGVEFAIDPKRNLKQSAKKLSAYLAGFSFVLLLGALVLTWGNAWKDWWIQTILFPQRWQSGSLNWPSLLAHFFPRNLFYTPLPILVFLMGAGGLVYALKKSSLSFKTKTILMLAALGMASWPQYYPITCGRHLFWSALPMLGFFPYGIHLFSICFPEKTRRRIVLIGFPLTLLVFFSIFTQINPESRYMREKLRIFYGHGKTFETGVLKGMRLAPRSYRYLKYVWDLHQQLPPGQYYLNTSNAALFNTFYPSGKSYSPVQTSDTGKIYPNLQNEEERFIREKKPYIFITTDTQTYMLFPKSTAAEPSRQKKVE